MIREPWIYYVMNQAVITFLIGDTSIMLDFSVSIKVQPSLYAELKTTSNSKEFIQTKLIRRMAFCSIKSENLLDFMCLRNIRRNFVLLSFTMKKRIMNLNFYPTTSNCLQKKLLDKNSSSLSVSSS